MENEIILSNKFIQYIKSDVDGNPIKVLFRFELLHKYGYDVVFNLYTQEFIAFNSAIPLPIHLKPVISGEVPYSVCQTFKKQIDETDTGSLAFLKEKKLRNNLMRSSR